MYEYMCVVCICESELTSLSTVLCEEAMSVCMCVYMCVCVHMCMHVCVYVYICVYVYGCMYVCVYVCMCVCVYVYVCMCICKGGLRRFSTGIHKEAPAGGAE